MKLRAVDLITNAESGEPEHEKILDASNTIEY